MCLLTLFHVGSQIGRRSDEMMGSGESECCESLRKGRQRRPEDAPTLTLSTPPTRPVAPPTLHESRPRHSLTDHPFICTPSPTTRHSTLLPRSWLLPHGPEFSLSRYLLNAGYPYANLTNIPP